ncbi:uroporphyrinogen decarboxylase family protein [Opitutaceae bacterium]|nr:uroporphyrinogen decarboxylase family protein [Opitutaceae bacterium]
MIKIQGSASKGWLHQEAGFKFEERYYFDPEFRWEQDRRIDHYLDERFPDYPIYNMESNLGQIEHTLEKQIIVGGIQPNLIMGLAAGADFFCDPDKDSDISIRPLEALLETPEKLPTVESFLASPLIKGFDAEIARIKADKPDYRIIPPYFWDTSGRATIHGFITTSMKLFGENIFLMMVDDPDLVNEVHRWIADVYTALIQHYSRLAELPVTSVHVGECSGTMLSPDQFSEFVVPHASQLGAEVGALRWHSCGASTHLIEPLGDCENLKIIDTGSSTRVANIRDEFGPDFEINVAPPVEVLMERADPHDIDHWLDEVLDGNADGPLKFVFHMEPGYSLDTILRLNDLLDRRGIIGRERLQKL